MPALGDIGFENAISHHALDGPYGQAQHLGGLAGAEVGLVDVAVCHREFLGKATSIQI